MASAFTGLAEPVSREGFRSVLDSLGIDVPELLAVLSVEARGWGFLPDRRPLILFERHIFHKRTGGKFSEKFPDISSSKAGGYAGMEKEYPRLEAAVALDRKAALESASWGLGQLMGFNAKLAGFEDAEAMVTAMMAGEDQQLAAMAGFLKSLGIHKKLAKRDWAGFAEAYNGPAYAKNQYDVRLKAAYQKFKVGPLPDLQVRTAQAYLIYLGYNPGTVDGVLGRFTRSAVGLFRQKEGLAGGERIDAGLIRDLKAAIAKL